MIRRHPLRLALALIAVVLATLAWHNRAHLQAFPDIIGAYSAKEYCSCRYVMDNPAPYCAGYVKQWLPLTRFLDDSTNKRVTAEGLGRSHSARWLDVRQGCRLE